MRALPESPGTRGGLRLHKRPLKGRLTDDVKDKKLFNHSSVHEKLITAPYSPHAFESERLRLILNEHTLKLCILSLSHFAGKFYLRRSCLDGGLSL